MRISIIGTGYVGLVTGACFADLGNDVVCIDVIEEKVHAINEGTVPIYEPGLEGLLRDQLRSGRLRATTDMDAVLGTELSFICVGTPSRKDGSLDLRYVRSAARSVGERLARMDGHHTVVVKSTVMPGTTREVVMPILEKASGKVSGKDFGMAMNPEFLKEGMAVQDFLHPDRVVVGAEDENASRTVLSLYSEFECPKLEVDTATAEMIKVSSNAFLATRISFVNEVGNICKTLNIDFRKVAEGMGLDPRIGRYFLRAGCGFGGSCFPKDLKGLIAVSKRQKVKPMLLEAVLRVNRAQPDRLVDLLERHLDPAGRKIAVLGLAFKPDTDDIREASSWRVVGRLLRKGSYVLAYDPKAMDNFRREYPDIRYCDSAKECVEAADAILILTEWKEFSDPSLYGDKLVVDGRGVVHTKNYEGICW
jgi:UDPglucose 6-dehydrogenase